eukprot:s72_g29.t1
MRGPGKAAQASDPDEIQDSQQIIPKSLLGSNPFGHGRRKVVISASRICSPGAASTVAQLCNPNHSPTRLNQSSANAMKRPLTAFSQQGNKARLQPRFALKPREEGCALVLREKKAPEQRRRVFTGPAEDISEEEEVKPLLVKRLSSSAPPPPPPFDENGEEAARRHCVFFHNAPKKVNEGMLKRVFERAGSVKRLRIFREDGKSQGMGLCEFVSPEGALAAAHILDGEKIYPSEPTPPGEPPRMAAPRNVGRRNEQRNPRQAQAKRGTDKRARTGSSPGARQTKTEENSELKPVGALMSPPPPPPVPILRPRTAREASQVKAEVEDAKVLAPSEAADGRISFYSPKQKSEQEAECKAEDSDSVSHCTDTARAECEPPELSSEESCEVETKKEPQAQSPLKDVDEEMKPVEEPAKPEVSSEPEAEESSCVYFHNVPFEVNEEDLLPLFERAGPVKALRLFTLKDGRSRGQGLCQFERAGVAEKAVRILAGCFLANPSNDSEKDSRELHVKIHKGNTKILDNARQLGLGAMMGSVERFEPGSPATPPPSLTLAAAPPPSPVPAVAPASPEPVPLLQPRPLQVAGGLNRMVGPPETFPFRHPDDSAGSAMTAMKPPVVQPGVAKGKMLAPLDEVLGNYLRDRTGGSEGMHVFDMALRVPPDRWCITRSEFYAFIEEVRELWKLDKIPDGDVPNAFHSDPHHGPNLYQVNQHFVKPVTWAAGGMSYALMKHPAGLPCQVFLSHAWAEGLFELGDLVHRGWPRLQGIVNLYCCLLANPQNLNIEDLLSVPPEDVESSSKMNKTLN